MIEGGGRSVCSVEKILYGMTRGLAYLLLKSIFRLQVEGRENIPTQGPLIVAANHVSILDPPVVSSALNRQVCFMAKSELFKNPVIGWYFRTMGTFPVRRGVGDRTAIKKALSILREGKVLGMFPEGTRRSGDVQMGVVMLALKTNTPILPVALFNTDRKASRGPVRVVIGKPFTLNTGETRPSRKEKQEMAQRVMESIGRLE